MSGLDFEHACINYESGRYAHARRLIFTWRGLFCEPSFTNT